ncbi:uncharacterized protein LOC123405785 [Hordeum vulgare subsp. vulgare]|uniref:uncharacterized protein LOC123405785 n=1 Tax=Hordeum vulgare subsp. vulgare TaxID=112509 RepID=UPI001D1A56A8|nr:uncharacterized protein LOC123405785 [Hordeum vulgare subsp. vulgare]
MSHDASIQAANETHYVPTLPWFPRPSPVDSYNAFHIPPWIRSPTTATHRPMHHRLGGFIPLLRLLADAPGSSCTSSPPSRWHQQRHVGCCSPLSATPASKLFQNASPIGPNFTCMEVVLLQRALSSPNRPPIAAAAPHKFLPILLRAAPATGSTSALEYAHCAFPQYHVVCCYMPLLVFMMRP